MDPRHRIQQNLDNIRARMVAAAARAGRPPEDVRLVAVTKTVGIEEAAILRDLGVTHLGENRVEVGRPKVEAVREGICWHMIGAVQRRKVRDIVGMFHVVDAVDRVKLAEALQRRCEEQDTHIAVLVEVNVSGEESKHGFAPEELDAALREVRQFDRLRVEGLMTMAPLGAAEAVVRSVFRRLRERAEALGLPEISMGMTDDFEIAIEEGATQVRIGRALFG